MANDDVSVRARSFDLTGFGEANHWRAFAPGLHIEDATLLLQATSIAVTEQQSLAVRAQLKREGYVQASGMDWGAALPVMTETVRALSAAGLSPVFAFLYDEFWLPFRKLAPVFEAVLGPYAILPDFWIWHVDPGRDESGWAPHRDKGHISLLPDGMTKSLTTWIPLTAATPLNSCMYVVPAMLDPTYGTVNDGTYSFAYQNIRALPAKPGDFLIWNQAVVHWGSRSSTMGAEPRISMAVEFQRTDQPAFNTPLIDPYAVIPFEMRLKLIAKQILQYRHMYKVAPEVEKMALSVVNAAN